VTGELSPLDQPDQNQPELRASHEDRDRVVEALRIAAGDGRLTAEELDDRLEVALTARTVRELTVLTTDLVPAGQGAVSAPAPRELLRISHLGGNARQAGHWVVPKRIDIDVAGGNVLLDFTHAVITGPVLPITARVRGGNLRIITRPGVEVDASEVSTIGGNMIVQTPRPGATPVDLRVELSGEIKGGNVRVHRHRRSFREWLRALMGRPEPEAGSRAPARR
jgi:hypothetical protein